MFSDIHDKAYEELAKLKKANKKLSKQLKIAKEALEKIGNVDDINSNFSLSTDECNYYIKIAEEALQKLE